MYLFAQATLRTDTGAAANDRPPTLCDAVRRGRPRPPLGVAFIDMSAQAPGVRDTLPHSLERAWSMLFATWLIAAIATLAALFLSEVMQVTPCVLCWYQRICMFPLVLLLPLGMFPVDQRVVRYALPLAAIGLAIALFHVLLVHGWIPEPVKPCRQGVPCDKNPIEWFGFVGIPDLSLVAFAAVTALLIGAHREMRK